MTMPLNRYETSTRNALLSALAAGLDPSQGMSIWNDLQGEYAQREQARAQAIQAQAQQLDQLRQLAVQSAQQGVPESALRTQFQAMMPHMPDRLSMGLDDTLTTLYPGSVPNTGNQNGSLNGMSVLAPPPESALPPFDATSIDSIGKATASAIADLRQADPTTFPSLGQVTQAVATQALGEYQFYKPQADTVIQHVYQMLMPNAQVAAGVAPFESLPLIGGQ